MKTLNDFNIKTKKPWEVEGIEWREVRLGEIVKIEQGKASPLKKLKKIGYPVFGANGLIGYWDNYMYEDPQVLIACRGSTCGIPNFSMPYSWINNNAMALIPKSNLLDKKFLFYFLILLWITKHISHVITGTGQPQITKTNLKNLKLPLPFRNGKPDLETQKKIVEYIEENFSRIEQILEKKKKELELLDELWESVLEEAFKPKDGEEWREVDFNKLISKEKYQVGKVKVRSNLSNFGKIPVVDQSQELIRSYLDDEKLKYKGPLPLIIFGDHTKVIKFINFPFIVGADGVKILIPNKDLIYPKYFYWLLRKVKLPEKGYARHFRFLKQATYLIPFRNGKPDLEKQKEIANYLDSVYEKIKTLKEKIQNQIIWLENMKGSILDEVFNHDHNI